MDSNIDFKAIEQKWQKKWAKDEVFASSPSKKEKYYVLEMFPYPSASFLHVGHVRNYTIGDVIARYKRMRGFNVLYPMGYDSFGLPAENAAKKQGIHPRVYTEQAIATIKEYQQKLGNSYDWNRQIATHEPRYYRWNQQFFIEFFKKGLVYRKEASVHWCPSCATVLANEEVVKGACDRCKTVVTEKHLAQWFFKITAYADELLASLDTLDWSERMKSLQRNWIGKSEGTEVIFKVGKTEWPVFTTRIDTLMGVTFLVVSAQHPRLMDVVTPGQKKDVLAFLAKIKKMNGQENITLEKDGVFTGSYATHPITGEQIPVWTGNFVVADYGSGMVMGVPAHDQRDFDFAQKYKVPVKSVIQSTTGMISSDKAFVEDGILYNSEQFNRLTSEEARKRITAYLAKKKQGRFTINYKLRDWLISRQRYWGTPIPMIHCTECGVVPVPEKDLPVLLPEDVTFKGAGNPLLTSTTFQKVMCPTCRKPARRDTDTMGGFMDSSWYFLRYCDPHNDKKPFDVKPVDYWMPVDQYIGGIEHAVGHLLYARFFTKVLRDFGYLSFDEPFLRLFNQGIVHKNGERMSKSAGNVVTQDEVSEEYGIDAVRAFLLFVSDPSSDMEWTDTGMDGISRFIRKVLSLSVKGKATAQREHASQKLIQEVTAHIDAFKFNLALIKLMQFTNSLHDTCDKESFLIVVRLLAPFCPHIAEELWERVGGKGYVSTTSWPVVDTSKINEQFDVIEQATEKVIGDIMNILKLVREKSGKEGEHVYVYVLPKELENYDAKLLSVRVGKEVKIYAVNDTQKYDPQSKASKAKPGKPGIYVE